MGLGEGAEAPVLVLPDPLLLLQAGAPGAAALLPLAQVQQGRFGSGAFVEALGAAGWRLRTPRVGDGRTSKAVADVLVNIHSGGPGLPAEGDTAAEW